MRAALLLSTLLSLAALTSCRNACAQLCSDIARYAEEECGFTVPSGEVRECVSDKSWGGSTQEERQVCNEFGDQFEDEWTCEDLEPYFE